MTEFDEDALAAAYDRGRAAEARGDLAAAADAFAEMLRLDPEDRCGVAVRLAAHGLADAPEKAPPAYVATLFDQNAETFDAMLVDQLGYHVPMMIREALAARGLGPFARLLDLGCGTGLTGESLRDLAAHRTGVDLSEGMLAVADDKDVYDELYVGDAEGFLVASEGESWDLIAATDVLPYLGPVEGLFAAAAARLAPGGVFAFSTETMAPEAFAGRAWTIGPKRRYAHDPQKVRAALSAACMAEIACETIVVRHEEGAPVPGTLVLARR